MSRKKEILKEKREKERNLFVHPNGVGVFSFARQSSGDEAESASITDQLKANRKTAESLGCVVNS